MAKQQSVEGDTKPCGNCKQTMTYNMKPEFKDNKTGEVYAAKLQWQNADGKSHYLAPRYADGKKVYPCRDISGGPQIPIKPTFKQVDLSSYKPEAVTPTQEALFVDLVVKAAEYTIIAQRELQKFTEIENPALKGLVTKLAFKMMDNHKGSSK